MPSVFTTQLDTFQLFQFQSSTRGCLPVPHIFGKLDLCHNSQDDSQRVKTLRWMGSFKLVRHFAGTRSPPRSLDVAKRIRCVAFGAKLVHETSLARNRHGKTAGNFGLADLQSLESGQKNGLHRSPVYLHKWILSQVCLEGFVTCCLFEFTEPCVARQYPNFFLLPVVYASIAGVCS